MGLFGTRATTSLEQVPRQGRRVKVQFVTDQCIYRPYLNFDARFRPFQRRTTNPLPPLPRSNQAPIYHRLKVAQRPTMDDTRVLTEDEVMEGFRSSLVVSLRVAKGQGLVGNEELAGPEEQLIIYGELHERICFILLM
jgi:hypothetical protein